MSSAPLLSMEAVGKTYPGYVPVPALRDTSLRLDAGDYLSIMGPSGSGKSTLLNLLGLLDRPTDGSYRIRGVETTSLSEPVRTALRSRVFGFVFQSFHLLSGRSALANVEIGMLYGAVPARRRRARAKAALDRVGLRHLHDADPRRLSGGERQRVAIARAIAGRPDVLLCDEPTGQLDSDTSERVIDLIEELNADGLAVVVVTHDERVGERARTRVRVRDGRVEQL